ncbi:cell division protein SepF [Zhurongbacter thermophilus]
MSAKEFDNSTDVDILIQDENLDIIVYRIADDVYSEEDPMSTPRVMSNVVKMIKAGITLILDFTEVDYPEKDRILTAARGAAHYLDGSAVKVTEDIYVVTGVDVGIKQWPRRR